MTEQEMIDELWADGSFNPLSSDFERMDRGTFGTALKEALQRQRQGCAEAYLKSMTSFYDDNMAQLQAIGWLKTETSTYQDIRNAPPKGEE